MKIVVDARVMGSEPSGIGIYAFYYIKELLKTEHELTLLSDVDISGEMKEIREHGVPIKLYGRKIYRSAHVLKYFSFVREALEEIQPDVFWEPNILIPRKLSGYQGKTMITIHDMFPVTHARYFGWKYSVYFRIMLKKTIDTSDIVLYDSKETKEEAERYFPQLKQKKTFIQYVIASKEAVKQTIAPETSEEYFLFVGNMEKRKGVDLLLDAYEMYRQKGGKKALVLAGKSRESDVDIKIEQIIAKYSDVKYYGYVSDEDKQRLYQNCSCFLFPSMAEGFGICVLEAMNYYKPIIASNLSIFFEVVGDCIEYFSLAGDRKEQVGSLSQKMLDFCEEVDKRRYDEAMERYMPETLGQKLADVLESI